MNTIGRIFKISIFGESHGDSVGIIIDGCPPGISLNITDFSEDLDRRKSGAKGTTRRIQCLQNIIHYLRLLNREQYYN